MKLFVTAHPTRHIEGFLRCDIAYGNWNVEQVPENSQIEIVAVDAIDHVDFEKRNGLVKDLVSRLRIGGTVVVTGLDASTLCRNLYYKVLTTEDFNKVIKEKQSIGVVDDLIKSLRESGLTIVSHATEGANYEITARR